MYNKYFSKYFIADPIYGAIFIDNEIIHKLINTFSFQRLKNIKQLGFNYFLYPTGTHTRFTHSLGVYWIAHQILDHKQHDLSNNEQLLFLVAALLHDIGHGPFSHAFEQIFNDDKHESKTLEILQSTEVKDILDQYKEQYHYDLLDNLKKIYTRTHHNSALVDLISSEIDIDRMDFLLRDAYFTGNSLGNFDLPFLLKGIVIEKNQLFFNKNVIPHLNDFILARINMYQSIYYHPKVIKLDFIFKEIIKRIKYLKLNKKIDFIFRKNLFFCDDKFKKLKSYLQLSDHDFFVDLKSLEDFKDPVLKFLVNTFFNWRSVKLISASLFINDWNKKSYDIIYSKISSSLKLSESIYFLEEFSPYKRLSKLINKGAINKIKIREILHFSMEERVVIKTFDNFCNIFPAYDETEILLYYLKSNKDICKLKEEQQSIKNSI